MSPKLILTCRVFYYSFLLEMILDALLNISRYPLMVYVHWILLLLSIFVMIVGIVCLLKRDFRHALSFLIIPLLYIFHVLASGFDQYLK